MNYRDILIVANDESPWRDYLEEFFDDCGTSLNFCENASAAGTALNHSSPGIIFLEAKLLTLGLAQKIKVLRASSAGFRTVRLGARPDKSITLPFDLVFPEPPPVADFQKQLLERLVLPEVIRILVVDDEPQIGATVKDFFEGRSKPVFQVTYAPNGEEGLKALCNTGYDIVLLDIKMPVKDGREVYREIVQRKISAAVIVFFDAIFGNEVEEIHRIGKPAIIEKGSTQSSMPELMALVKKKACFG